MTPRFRAKPGFTLVELLVAMSVGALVLVAMAQVISQSLTLTKRANTTLLAGNAASAAIDLLAADLDSLAVTSGSHTVLQADKGAVGSALPDVARLMMLTLPGSDNGAPSDRGQVRAVSYRLLFQDPITPGGSRPVYGIYRTMIAPQQTFDAFIGVEDLGDAFDAVPTTLDDYLVGNVVDFQVRLYAAGSSSALNSTTANGSDALPIRINGPSVLINNAPHTGATPEWLEITLVILQDRDNAVARIRDGTLSLDDAIRQYGVRLSRKVALRKSL